MSLFFWLFYIALGLAGYFLLKIRLRLKYWKSRGIPCEEPHRIMGNITGIRKERSYGEVWLDYYNKFKGTGPFAGFYWFQRPGVFVLDTALAKQVLIKDFNKFTDRGFYSNEKDDPLSGQLFLLDGHKWRNMRNKLSPTFTSGKMKYMFPTVIRVGEEFERVFHEEVKKNNVIDVKDMLARFTTDVIGTCAFGIECNSLKDPNTIFRIMGKKQIGQRRNGRIAQALITSYPNLARKLHIKITPEDVEEFFMGLVSKTIEHREKNNVRRNDFMDMLIDLKNNKLMKSEHGDELTNLTLGEVAAQAVVFFNAGFETSSTTMSFALYELAQHQHIQERARKEVLAAFEQHDGKFEYECLKELQYLDQIISETLRLYTVLPILNRFALEDYAVPGHPKYVIKKGMPVVIPAGAMHRDERFYPNPDVFNPDHFTPEKVKNRDSVEWLPFGDGPRNCIGMRFGMMQSRIGLALLLKNFTFSVCSQTPIPLKYNKSSFLIASEGGIMLKVETI